MSAPPSAASPDSAGSCGGQTPPWLIHSGINARVLFCLLHFNSHSRQQGRRQKPALGNTFHPKHDAALLLSPLTHFCPADFSGLGILSLGRFSYISPVLGDEGTAVGPGEQEGLGFYPARIS